MGRAAAGVRSMRLGEGDEIVSADVVGKDDTYVFTVTEKGMGKITETNEYREQSRGGSGVKVGAITEKTGDIIGVTLLSPTIKKE